MCKELGRTYTCYASVWGEKGKALRTSLVIKCLSSPRTEHRSREPLNIQHECYLLDQHVKEANIKITGAGSSQCRSQRPPVHWNRQTQCHCGQYFVLNEPHCRYRTAYIQMFLSYYITYTAGEIFRYFRRCAYVSVSSFFSVGLRITNPFTTRTYLGKKI